MSQARLLALVALGISLASPAFPQTQDNAQGRIVSTRPVTITTAGGRSYIVGVQRHVVEPAEAPAPGTPKVASVKAPSADKAAP